MNRISLIIPSYNDGFAVLALLESVKNKSIHQVIVVESGDATYFPKAKKILSKAQLVNGSKGRAAQMNNGAKLATGNLLWFVHADSDISTVDLAALRKIQAPAWGGFRVKFTTPKRYFRYIEFSSHVRAKYLHIVFGDQGIFITKDLWQRTRGFVAPYEDMNMSRVLRAFKKNIALDDQIVSSPRRFFKHGVLRTHLVMGAIFFTYLARMNKTSQWLYQFIR